MSDYDTPIKDISVLPVFRALFYSYECIGSFGQSRMCTSAAMVGAGLALTARWGPQGVRYLMRHFLLTQPRECPHTEMTHSTKNWRDPQGVGT